MERLKAELEQSRRAGKRQAALFSRGSPKADPKRPGRMAGHPSSHRPPPRPDVYLYGRYVRRAGLVEEFDLKGTEGTCCFLAVRNVSCCW
ncbi:MAG: hypothetical protein NVSMB9_33370 [Isosphaeraceae bacterium]